MGNIISNSINYKHKIQEGIPLIKEWISNQSEELNQTENYKELKRFYIRSW